MTSDSYLAGGEIVLVTGASGFIGRHTCHWLVGAGYRVRGVTRSASRARCLPPGVEPVIHDLAHVLPGSALTGVRAVVHLAARVHVMRESRAQADARYHEANVTPTRRLVEAAREAGVRRFVFVSSVKVHGERSDHVTSTASELAPNDPYGRSKVEAERVVRTVSGPMEWTIVRPTFVFGPGGAGNFSRLVTLTRLAAILPLPLASVRNRRSMIYVENLAALLGTCVAHPAAHGRIYLAADTEAVGTVELIHRLGAALRVRPRLLPFPVTLLRAGARIFGRRAEIGRLTESFEVDSSAARTELGWKSHVPLDDALRRAVRGGAA